MTRINVLIARTSPGFPAESVAKSVAARADMHLLHGTDLPIGEVDSLLDSLPDVPQCAVLIVGPMEDDGLVRHWLARRPDIVVMLIDGDSMVSFAASQLSLGSLLDTLRDFVARVGSDQQERVVRIRLDSSDAGDRPGRHAEGPHALANDRVASPDQSPGSGDEPPNDGPDHPLLDTGIAWLHAILRDAVERVPDDSADLSSFSNTRASLLAAFEAAPVRTDEDIPDYVKNAEAALNGALEDADRALADPDRDNEPLAIAKGAFDLDPFEFRVFLLALAPELDFRFQRAVASGTFGLYSTLLGPTADVRSALAAVDNLDRWLVFDEPAARRTAADEALRIDPYLAQWIFGASDELTRDPRVARVLHPDPWPGAGLLRRHTEQAQAANLIRWLRPGAAEQWLVLDGDDPAAWRALLELGARMFDVRLMRADPFRLSTADIVDVEASARRLARAAVCSGGILAVDLAAHPIEGDEDWLRRFLAAIGRLTPRVAVISTQQARIVRLLGSMPFQLETGPPLSVDARTAAMQAAARDADAFVTAETAVDLASRYPLPVDSLEFATTLARSRPRDFIGDDASFTRFTTALKEVAAEGLSHLAERIEPIFDLDNVVLPSDRRQQLIEIVDNVRLASRVLDEWKFRDQLPYGRGVTALFHGPSGTGKTMGAIAIARRLGIQILRLDLSKVVSKYIGDTEKNIDRVFSEAERTGSAILIDEAESLLARRSEVRDAHDRYANIEVAFLLTRMEAFGSTAHGRLAILTTNMRQSLDPAFVRRLRFIIEFPRPNAEARERIWRQCLPAGSHRLDDAAFKQLARRIDLTGGHIRQIALRAAFMAAAAGTLIGLPHIAHAANAELAKLGMPPADFDLGGAKEAA